MKLRIIITLLLLSIFTQANAVTITKIASNPNPQIGEEFEYTVNVTGITSMTELGYIKDVLDPNLLYLGSDFTTSNSVTGPYTFLCPTQMGSFSVVNTAGTLRFQFPTHNSCGGNGWGSVSFKIKVAVKSTVCGTSITQIKNNVELYNWNSIRVARSNSPAIITIDRTNPWKLTKTFRALSNGFLVYDIRLSSSVSKYAEDVLRNVQFTDDFISDPCAGIDIASSEVYYLKDENKQVAQHIIPTPTQATFSQTQQLDISQGLRFNLNGVSCN